MAKINATIAGKIMTLLGYDGTNFQNVAVDAADGHLQVDVLTAPLPEASGTLYNYVHIMTAAGNYMLTGHTVAANTVFVLTSMGAYNSSGVTGAVWEGAKLGASNRWFMYQALPAPASVVFWAGRLYIPAGFSIISYFAGVGNGDVLVFDYSGYTLQV